MSQTSRDKARDDYSKELITRFEQFRKWAMDNWPVPDQPLNTADFSATEREINLLLGARLHTQLEAHAPEDFEPQYLPVTPAPWP